MNFAQILDMKGGLLVCDFMMQLEQVDFSRGKRNMIESL